MIHRDEVTIDTIAHHRNGIAGAGFSVVLFRWDKTSMVGIVFDEPGHVAVLSWDLLTAGVISFGLNSYRGDVFEQALRAAIAEKNKEDLS
jgi:hypothetical protein